MKLFDQKYDPVHFLQQAEKKGQKLCGYYNENWLMDIDGRKVVVRRPIEGAEDMDLGFVKEEEVLLLLEPYNLPVPHVLSHSKDPFYFIENFIEGDVLNDTHPRGTLLPDHFIPDVVDIKRHVWSIDYRPLLTNFPDDWPADGDVAGFFRVNLAKVEEIWQRYKVSYGSLYRQFGGPDNPLEFFEEMDSQFTSRPFVLAHSDIHRKNCIIKDGKTWFLDWERSLIADPVYDVAVHMHKMYYTPEEDERFLRKIKEAMTPEQSKNMMGDLKRYLQLEQVKSFIVDTVRAHRHLSDPNEDPDVVDYVAMQFSRKISQVQDIWGGRQYSPDEVKRLMRDFNPAE